VERRHGRIAARILRRGAELLLDKPAIAIDEHEAPATDADRFEPSLLISDQTVVLLRPESRQNAGTVAEIMSVRKSIRHLPREPRNGEIKSPIASHSG